MTTSRTQTPKLLDEMATTRADAVMRTALDALFQGKTRPRGVVVTAPAGAGKSHLVAQAAERAFRANLRIAVAVPTNEQAFGLVRTLASIPSTCPDWGVTFVPASEVSLPEAVAGLPGVQSLSAQEASGESLLVGTLSKLGDAYSRGHLRRCDVLLVDEAYQADSAKYYAIGGLAPLHLLVGDGGQINPFSTISNPQRWRGLAEDPLQTAVGVLTRNRPATPVHRLPITRRLDARAVRVAQLFYPDLCFVPAVLPGVRQLSLRPSSGSHNLDTALDRAAQCGWAHIELPRKAVLQADPETVHLIARLVERLLARGPQVRCERFTQPRPLRPAQIAVGVSHNDQAELLRVALAERNLEGVVVETANKLQGLEFEVVFAWHPLAGLPEADSFHLEPGRLCVLLTRHRQACVVIGRAGDADLLAEEPPATPAFLGWDADPVLDGWEIHRQVFEELETVRVSL